MNSDVEKILYTEDEIRARVQELGEKISKDYGEVLAIGILKGASIFYADLVRAIKIPVYFDFMRVSSYGENSVSSGKVNIVKDLETDIAGKDVLIVEDIVDTGITMSFLLKVLKERNPKSVKIAALLDKPERRVANVNIDYLGFNVPDEFLVGYGFDYSEKYRNLPYIGILKREVYE